MNPNQRLIRTALSASLIIFAAGAASAAEAPEKQPAAKSTTVSLQASTIAANSLALQPGDQAIIDRTHISPIEFVEQANSRTFTGQLIVAAKSSRIQSAKDRVAPLTLRTSRFVEEYVVDVPAGMSEGELAAILLATGDYEYVEPNWTLYPTVTPNDSQFGSSWQHTRLQSTAAWDLHTGNSNVIVAVCDSGVDLNHPDLAASLVPGFNAVSGRSQTNNGEVNDINGHGTFVAGCAAARGNNNTGVVGVGWNFSIMPIRVTNNTNGTASMFALHDGARWAAENGAQIVNVSFSGGTSASNQSVGSYVKSLGSLLFWSSGNDDSFVTPSRPDYVLVGSTTSGDNRSWFSNFGPAVDLVAPGSSVRSTSNGGGYRNSSGTSFAAPIAAGVGAMIYSVNPSFSAHDVQRILYNSVDDLGAPGKDDSFGRGRVNTLKAIQLAQTYTPPTIAPLNESFETAAWQNTFMVTSGSVETDSPVDTPDGSSVLVLDGNDAIETDPLAGRALADPFVLSFSLRASGIEAGESLDIQYLQDPEVASNSWVTIESITPDGLVSDEFVSYSYQLPAGFEWHGVKLRIAADGSDSSDRWMIDSFSLGELAPSTAPLEEHFESATASIRKWETNDNTQVSLNNNNYALEMLDAAVLTSRDIPLDTFGFVPSYIYFDASTNAQVLDTDTLNVEVFNIGGSWTQIDTILGSELSNAAQVIEYDVPITSIALPDMRLRLTASTAGAFIIDNVYVGVEPYVAGCNAADINGDGVLNFFDISAFLIAFSAGEPAADLNNDWQFNFFDISAYLTEFGAGCP